ncbi:MAG: hypothetical protein JO031_00825, partial [Ktedonobacteraceae bacterium]|nr:hypothetical protein [Ktedonobacteraceae bacterium]
PLIGQRLIQYTVHYLQMHEQDYNNIDLEINNLLAGLDMAITLKMSHELFVAIICFAPYMHARGHYALADHYLQIAFKNATQQHNAQERLILLQILAEFGCNV